MQDEISIELQELTKLYVVCPNEECRAEVGFDLTKNLLIQAVSCPVCHTNILEVQRQDRFQFTWATFMRTLLQAEGKPRLFFRLQRTGREEAAD